MIVSQQDCIIIRGVPKNKRCPICVTHPKLIQNGDGYNLKCVICECTYLDPRTEYKGKVSGYRTIEEICSLCYFH